ncbi:MAG: electron transfer flavoprotein subunit beta/FixA family protein [Clostridia bacterium]|nr:electron transfer flavoprotein subunit beta/FixA family protein [Clostridia bacterium]
MNIFVCIKQVPATNRVQIDAVTGVLKREGAKSKMNPFDLYAIETALRLRESGGGRVAAGTMGPPQAEAVVREALMMGADEGCLFSDKRLSGADVLATSYTLAQAIRAVGDFDLILCGKQTTDGDTAQVGPAIAEHLSIPHAAWVTGIERVDDGVYACQQLQSAVETVFMPFPCLITVEQGIYTPRLPSLKAWAEAEIQPIQTFTLDDFPDTNELHYGLSGSPTQVERIFPPACASEREIWRGDDSAGRLHEHLKRLKYI